VARSDGAPGAIRRTAGPPLAVVLAAGRGSRLRPHTAELPKALLRVGGATLLERQLAALAAVGVRRAVVVAGHGSPHVRALLDRRQHGQPAVGLAVNGDYASTGTARSLRLALDGTGSADAGEVLVVEGDVLLDPEALRRLAERDDRHDVRVLASREPLESSLIRADAALTVQRIVHRADADAQPVAAGGGAEFFNLSCYRFALPPAELARLLDEALERAPAVNVERAIDALCGTGRVGLALVDPRRAIEIDTPEDLAAARRYVALGEWRGPHGGAVPQDADGKRGGP
jgi:L-glutamine-phosphate cytidylyltransferase